MQPTFLANNGRKANPGTPPSFDRWRERLLAAEQSAGWLAECDDAGRFLAVSRELVDALAAMLRQLAGDGPVLEVCAGSGELAQALACVGVRMQAVDTGPVGPGRRPRPDVEHSLDAQVPSGGRDLQGSEHSQRAQRQVPFSERDLQGRDLQVLPMSAEAALRRFLPKVVLGAFVPFDGGVDEAVLACPTVEHYVVLNARLGGSLGSPTLWQATNWNAEPLDPVRRWMLTRHDVWLDQPGWSCADLLQHGEAWLFTRTSSPSAERACR